MSRRIIRTDDEKTMGPVGKSGGFIRGSAVAIMPDVTSDVAGM